MWVPVFEACCYETGRLCAVDVVQKTEAAMSRLYYTEEGRVLPSLCEELTTHRRARKVFRLPSTSAPGRLFVLARAHAGCTSPLRMAVNGSEMEAILPVTPGRYRWHEVAIDRANLVQGDNAFELWTDSTAMDAWSLAIEPGHGEPNSFLSDDGGHSWRNIRMAYLNAVRGEYVVRIRLDEGEDPVPPAVVWEDPDDPRVAALLDVLPSDVQDGGEILGRVRALSSFLASSWEHTNSQRAAQYAPWDAATILAWGAERAGHNGKRPIVMCVHYAAAFVSCAQAVGIPARCAVLTAPNGRDGHFVAEVWLEAHGKWAVVDPNADALFVSDDVPMSMGEIQAAGTNLREKIQWGSGTEYQRTFPHMVTFIQDNMERGVCFAHRSVWYRSDLLSRPEFSPPGHGSLTYCETGLIWEERDRDRGFGMFPFFGDRAYFDSPPASAGA